MTLYQSQRSREDCIGIAESMESNHPIGLSTLNPQLSTNMGCIKHYVGNLVCLCSDERFGQEAVETAIFNGRVLLTYKLEQDLELIMGPASLPAKEPRLYDQLVEEYQAEVRRNLQALTPTYAPILEQLAA